MTEEQWNKIVEYLAGEAAAERVDFYNPKDFMGLVRRHWDTITDLAGLDTALASMKQRRVDERRAALRAELAELAKLEAADGD